ncbi:MAG TPA: zinc ribbon domain-containing protein, partial [Mycobacterium sp.]|nr:zinc ribbon domain-containing protein [Mycobacterium sp.]
MTTAVPVMRCPVCNADVPAAAFCGACGAHLSPRRGDGRGMLRPVAYGAAPGEHVVRLSVASTLFPHLPDRSRAPFRVALAVLFLTLVVLA